MSLDRTSIRLLFRTYEGSIDRRTWRTGTLLLAALLVPLTGVWLILAPATHRDLSTPELLDARALFAFVYLIVFAFAVILIAVCWTNLSAKRFRAVGRPGAFAGLLPFAALIDGAAHWFQLRAPDVFPDWALMTFDVVLTAVALWSFYELGLAKPGATGSSNLSHE